MLGAVDASRKPSPEVTQFDALSKNCERRFRAWVPRPVITNRMNQHQSDYQPAEVHQIGAGRWAGKTLA